MTRNEVETGGPAGHIYIYIYMCIIYIYNIHTTYDILSTTTSVLRMYV